MADGGILSAWVDYNGTNKTMKRSYLSQTETKPAAALDLERRRQPVHAGRRQLLRRLHRVHRGDLRHRNRAARASR